MTKTQISRLNRKERLMPNGVPKYVRIYDNGGLSIDRYTCCYTGKYRGNGWFQYVGMSKFPFSPLGFGQHGENQTQIDAPQGWPPSIGRKCHLGIRIPFSKLPIDCQKLVISDYKDIWNLNEPEIPEMKDNNHEIQS